MEQNKTVFGPNSVQDLGEKVSEHATLRKIHDSRVKHSIFLGLQAKILGFFLAKVASMSECPIFGNFSKILEQNILDLTGKTSKSFEESRKRK